MAEYVKKNKLVAIDILKGHQNDVDNFARAPESYEYRKRSNFRVNKYKRTLISEGTKAFKEKNTESTNACTNPV